MPIYPKLHVDIVITHLLPKIYFPLLIQTWKKSISLNLTKESFQVYDTERAIRANSNVISPKGFTKHTTTLTEHDLAYPIDYREEEEAKKN